MNVPTSNGVRNRADAGRAAERPGDAEHDEPHRDVRSAERERRVLRDALVQQVPGREPELRLENEDDRKREEEEPEDEARVPRDIATADARMRLR